MFLLIKFCFIILLFYKLILFFIQNGLILISWTKNIWKKWMQILIILCFDLLYFNLSLYENLLLFSFLYLVL